MDFARRPGDDECFDYHRDYVAKVPDGSILDTLEEQLSAVPAFMQSIDPAQMGVIHSPYAWTIRTVLAHCCDAERVFGYRALRFATGDATDLPGWDENFYASCGYGVELGGEELAEEFAGLRQANLRLLRRVQPKNFDQSGTADGRKVSVRTLAWLMAGHWLHHHEILCKRLTT